MKTIKTMIAALVLTIGTITIARAQTRVHVSFNSPGVHVGVGNYHPYYAPAPVVYDPYYAPVGYHRYYSHPVVYRTYYRHAYVRPVYHRVYRRW